MHLQRIAHIAVNRLGSSIAVQKIKMDQKLIRLPKVGEENGIQGIITKVAGSLERGGIISVPTDTIYGIAAMSQNSEAIEKIYDIKHRNTSNPIAICVADISDINKWAHVTVSKELLADLLPGPVTLVFQRTVDLNPTLNPMTDLVGVRIPANDCLRRLCRHFGSPLALTSANISKSTSTLAVEEFKELWPRLDFILDAGRLSETQESRLGSTVVNLSTQGHYTIIREGSAYKSTVEILKKHKLMETISS
ncbi:unnamed protein product [Owenia fusiformis]|uniref:Threonylcarbamoyl-AMP synthase n=1 Tax=Owenia fusiformis TaxID=6347 RepID=A0A8J1XIL7_OWEFU|nr:unnamed protein product [Owenia fusiformis]